MPYTRCVATWPSHSAGTSCAMGLQASRLQPDGCDPSFSIFFFSEQPRRTSPRNSHMRLAVISRDPHPHQATLWENSQYFRDLLGQLVPNSVESSPPSIYNRSRTATFLAIQVNATSWAQPRTVNSAQRSIGKLDQDGFADHRC